MRSMWSGSLSFGLINIPIKLYTATDSQEVSFDLLHKTDLSPIRYARICKEEEKEVPYKDIVKGYEYQKGEYVVISDEDIKRSSPEKINTIEIIGFANEDEIDTIYYEKPYFLEPDKTAAHKAYALLREALLKSKKVGIVRFIFKNRGHIGVIKPYKNAIVLDQIRYASEIRDIEDLKLPDQKIITKKEVDMALKLVQQLTTEFTPDEYHDTYVDNLKKVIEDKVNGISPKKRKGEAPKKTTKVHDIMSLLKASLKEEEEEAEEEHEEKASRKKKTKTRKKG